MSRLIKITSLTCILLLLVETQANPFSFPESSNRRSSNPYEGRTYDSQGREISGTSDTSARSVNGYQSNRNQIDISDRPNSDFNRLLTNRQPFALKYDDDYDDAALPDKPENAYNAYNRPQSDATGYTNSKYGGVAYDDESEERHGHKFKKGKHKRKYQQQPCIPVPFSGGNSYRSNARDVGSGRTLPLFNIYYNQPYGGGGGYPSGYQDPSSNRPQYSHTGGYLCVPQYGGGGGGGFGGGPLGFFGQGGLFDFTSSGVSPQRPQRPISSSSAGDNYNDGVSGGSYRPPIADIVQSAGGNVVEIVNALRPGDVLGSVANILNAVANRIGGVVGASPIGGGSFTGGTFGGGSFGSGSLGGGTSPISSAGGGVSPVVETGSSSVDSGLVSGIADTPNDPVNENVIRKIGREYWSLFT